MQPMPDFSLYECGGQRLQPVPHVGLVIGTCGSAPFVHLHLEQALRMYGPFNAHGNVGLPILVVNDGDEDEANLQYLCEKYGAEYATGSKLGHAPGDLRSFLLGLEWAERNNIQILAKMSRRFIPLRAWRQELVCLYDSNRYCSAFGRKHDETGYLRTDAIALRVDKWGKEIQDELRNLVNLGNKGIGVESTIGSFARVNGGVEPWNIVGESINRPHLAAMQWRGHYPYAYGDLARSLGLPYMDIDFERGTFFTPPDPDEAPASPMPTQAVVVEREEPVATPPQKPIPIITAADDNAVALAVVLGKSLRKHMPENPRWCLTPVELKPRNAERLENAGWELHCAHLEDGASFGSVQSPAMLFRNQIPSRFRQVDMCLYLDADTFLVQPIPELENLAEDLRRSSMATAAFPYCRPWYYNTGVMIMDLVKWRENHIGSKATDYWRKYRDAGCDGEVPYDECALNEAMNAYGVMRLPEAYNFVPGVSDHEDPIVVHWRGPKPLDPEAERRFPGMTKKQFDAYEAKWKEIFNAGD